MNNNTIKPEMTVEAIQSKIDENRLRIDWFLSSNQPLDVIYFNIRVLSARNERLIKQLKGDNNG